MSDDTYDSQGRKLYPAICSVCNEPCTVPFEPRPNSTNIRCKLHYVRKPKPQYAMY